MKDYNSVFWNVFAYTKNYIYSFVVYTLNQITRICFLFLPILVLWKIFCAWAEQMSPLSPRCLHSSASASTAHASSAVVIEDIKTGKRSPGVSPFSTPLAVREGLMRKRLFLCCQEKQDGSSTALLSACHPLSKFDGLWKKSAALCLIGHSGLQSLIYRLQCISSCSSTYIFSATYEEHLHSHCTAWLKRRSVMEFRLVLKT